jgi:uncharacterized protein (TIGR00297 family)
LSRPLTAGGTFAALGVGVLTVLGALYGWTIFALPFVLAVLFGFFLTSVALSHVGRARKRLLVDIPKSGPRDALQVLANGGVATLCAVAAAAIDRGGFTPPHLCYVLLWAFVGAYAAATADTWSTEIGSAFGGTPRSIVGFAPVATGLSGGVTLVGSAAMLAGAAWIALIWALPQGSWTAFWIVTAAGVAGALADSVAGATLQELRRCPRCDRPTETAIHLCATPTVALRGIPWMNNDAVNAFATATGALAGAALFSLFA